MTYYYSFSTLVPLIFFLPFLHSVSSNLIQDSCQKAAYSDPNLNYDFCVARFESNPRSQKASSLKELVAISIELTISNGTNISSCITQLISKSKTFDKHAKICLQDCLELYSDACLTLQEAVTDFRSEDYEGAAAEISSAMDASTTCEDGFKDKKGEISPVTKESNIFFQLAAISLAFINMLLVP